MRRIRMKIYGKVQGVGFRFSAAEKAKELGVGGWVRNCPDGCVELAVEGEDEAVLKMEQWACRGPSRVKVKKVEKFAEEPEGIRGFDIKV